MMLSYFVCDDGFSHYQSHDTHADLCCACGHGMPWPERWAWARASHARPQGHGQAMATGIIMASACHGMGLDGLS